MLFSQWFYNAVPHLGVSNSWDVFCKPSSLLSCLLLISSSFKTIVQTVLSMDRVLEKGMGRNNTIIEDKGKYWNCKINRDNDIIVLGYFLHRIVFLCLDDRRPVDFWKVLYSKQPFLTSRSDLSFIISYSNYFISEKYLNSSRD